MFRLTTRPCPSDGEVPAEVVRALGMGGSIPSLVSHTISAPCWKSANSQRVRNVPTIFLRVASPALVFALKKLVRASTSFLSASGNVLKSSEYAVRKQDAITAFCLFVFLNPAYLSVGAPVLSRNPMNFSTPIIGRSLLLV